MAEFDPRQYGAVPEEGSPGATATAAFDPTQYGAVPYEEPVPEKTVGQRALDDVKLMGETPSKIASSLSPKNMANNLLMNADAVKTGIRRFGAGINQFLLPMVDSVAGSKLAANDKAYQQEADQEFNQRYGDDKIARGIAAGAEIAPYFTPMGAINRGKGVLEFGKYALKNAGVGAGMGAITYDPSYEHSIPGKAATGFAIGGIAAGIPGAAELAGKAYNKLRPANWGDITEAEMRQAVQDHKGLKTGLGDIINSPGWKKFQENIIEPIPLSGVNSNQLKIGKQLTGEAENLLNKIKPKEMPEDFGKAVLDEIKAQKSATGKEKTMLYQNANQLADDLGAKVNPLNYSKQVNEELAKLDDYIITDTQRNELKKLLDSTSNFNKGNLGQALGASPKGESFNKTYLTKGYLNNAYEQALKENDPIKMGMIGRLRDALKSDVGQSVKTSGLKPLEEAFQNAEDFYKTRYSKFKDPDILKFTNRSGDSDTIENYFLQTGKTDKAGKLAKLMDILPEDMNKTLAYRYLSKAYRDPKFGKEDLDPIEMSKLYHSLGERTRNRLIPYKDFKEGMTKLASRLEKNQEAFKAMYNPPTGNRLKAGLGMMAANITKGTAIPLAIPAQKALTSEWLREKTLKSLMKGKKGGLAADIFDDTTLPLIIGGNQAYNK